MAEGEARRMGVLKVERTPEEQMEILMGLLLDLQKQMAQDRQKMAEMIDKKVDAALETKRPILEGRESWRYVLALKNLLIEKGLITKEDFWAQREKTKGAS